MEKVPPKIQPQNGIRARIFATLNNLLTPSKAFDELWVEYKKDTANASADLLYRIALEHKKLPDAWPSTTLLFCDKALKKDPNHEGALRLREELK